MRQKPLKARYVQKDYTKDLFDLLMFMIALFVLWIIH